MFRLKWNEGNSCIDQKPPMHGAPGSSFVLPRGCGGGSVKNKVARIIANASGAISPRMRHSFVDRQYWPSSNMDWSEWEIILEELTRMGLFVTQEPIS
jgi:hypothetical protein